MKREPLVIAIPSKGRIEEEAHGVFSRAGLPIVKEGGARDYTGSLRGAPDIVVRFLSSSEIVAALESGAAHLGITGRDLIYDRGIDPERTIAIVKPFGFGRADVVVAVPRAWIDVTAMADLAEVASDFRHRHHRHMRVATKYTRLARQHFAAHGVVDYRLVDSAGATEAAPSNGQAELIVDITTTGATLSANRLKVLSDGVILRSEAVLAASLTAPWGARARAALGRVLDALWSADQAQAKPKPKAPRSNPLTEALLPRLG